MTVKGEIPASSLGKTLIHEHILVDFIGAKETGYHRWDKKAAFDKALPYLQRAKTLGFSSICECTPAYLGRDPILLKMLSEETGLNILTNTGYYGARKNKFLPEHAFMESASQLAGRWISEWKNGIEDTGIKPGFIKIGVDEGGLTELHIKLVKAAARTHLETGLTIVAHTGASIGAFHEMEILREEGVAPGALVWVHAQNEQTLEDHVKAARMGAWVSLDGVRDESYEDYVDRLVNMKNNGVLSRALISHDAGWYTPGEDNGGEYVGYETISGKLIPALKQVGFNRNDFNQLLVTNPKDAFSIKIRKK